MTALSPQIPLDLFEPEAPSFANFLVGNNEELITRLYAIASEEQLSGVLSIWGGSKTGKTHLLKSIISAFSTRLNWAMMLNTDSKFPDNPFTDARIVLIDDADRLSLDAQAWLFNAFNHVVGRGGLVLTSGSTSPLTWPLRDDLRTRLSSGLIFEVRAAPQDELPSLLRDYAQTRGIALSEEVLTYILTYTRRDVAELCQTIMGLDRLSLSLKRGVTVPLVRAYLAQQAAQTSKKEPLN